MKEIKKYINKERAGILITGILLGILVMLIFYPERIAKLKNGEYEIATVGKESITSDDLYINLKKHYAAQSLLDLIDSAILDKKYETLEKNEQEQIDTGVTNYLTRYMESYNKTEKEVLEMLGFETKEEFADFMTLDFKRDKAYKEYIKEQLTEEEIENFYKNDVFGDATVKHILVKISSEVNDEKAKEKATEILNKLKSGSSWDDLKNEYKSDITEEEFTVSYYDNLEEEFLKAVSKLEDGKYTTSLVKTSYGYHIIYKESSKEKPALNETMTKLKTALTNKKIKEETNIYEKTLIKIREENKLKIKDTELKKAYEKYTEKFTEE